MACLKIELIRYVLFRAGVELEWGIGRFFLARGRSVKNSLAKFPDFFFANYQNFEKISQIFQKKIRGGGGYNHAPSQAFPPSCGVG